MQLKRLEVTGGEGGGVFSLPTGEGDGGGHRNGAIWWKRRREEGRAKGARSGRAEFNTKPTSRRLCLWGLLLKAALLPFKTPFFAAGFEHP